MRRISWIVLGVVSVSFVGCYSGAPLENKEQFLERDLTGEGACDPTPVLESCSGGICHSLNKDGSEPSGSVNLFVEGFEDALLDAPASYRNVDDSENCPDEPELLINTASPEESLLLKKIRGEQSCGLPMPYTKPLSDKDIDCLEAWVLRLAASN